MGRYLEFLSREVGRDIASIEDIEALGPPLEKIAADERSGPWTREMAADAAKALRDV